MTFLLTTAVCWLAATSVLSAQVSRKEGPAGVSLTMLWNLEWSDQTGAPYRHQPVVTLQINNADLTKQDIEEIAAFRALANLELGWAPEGLTLLHADLSPLRNLKALESLVVCIQNPAALRLGFLQSLQKLELLEIWRQSDRGIPPPVGDRGQFFLHQADAETIGRLPNLDTLLLIYLDNLNDELIALVTKSGRLRRLELAAPKMTDASLKFIAANQGLTSLRLTAPNLTDEVGEMAARLEKLSDVSISSRKTSGNALKGFAKMRALKSLSLRMPNASPGDFALLRTMTRLEGVKIDGCMVTEEALRQLAGHPNLKNVFLPGADDSPAAREIIMNLPGIDYAELGRWKFKKEK